MKLAYLSLYFFIKIIAFMVFIAGLCFAVLGIYEFFHSLNFSTEGTHDAVAIAILLLKTIYMFLIAIVCFIFSLGLMLLFDNKQNLSTHLNLPEWLNINNFMQLKVILWEAILTTLVVSYLATLVQLKFKGLPISTESLIIPGAILLISISLYALKKSEKH